MNFPQGKPDKVTLSEDILDQLAKLLPLPKERILVDIIILMTIQRDRGYSL
jgi:hypothetical protein